MRKILLTSILAAGCAVSTSAFAQPDAAHQQKADAMIEKTIAYLKTQQDPAKGGWAIPPEGPVYPAITGLVLNGMLMQPGVGAEDESVSKAISFLLKYQQPDGGIYDKVLPSYNTSLTVSALAHVNRADAKQAVKKGIEFLRTLQWGETATTNMPGETGQVGRDHVFYGGVGYGRHGRPDNSNVSMFIDAMHAAGVESDDPAMQRAIVFLSRTQMLDATNDQTYADGSNQGGFIYATSVNKDRVGVGQSNAGEIIESLSGPAGTSAHVRFKKGADGKAGVKAKKDVEALLAKAAEQPGLEKLKDGYVVALGVSSDGLGANDMEIRTALTDPEQLRQTLAQALASDIESENAIRAERVEAWKGVSRLRSYGSMTYAGFKSMIYAGLKKDDPRVVAAHHWITNNYTLAENPSMGTDGLYYYYIMFSRAMDAYGEAEIAVHSDTGGSGGPRRNWANDLIDRLAELQNEDGSFKSVDDRWMENNTILITAYSLIALQHAAR